MASQSATSDDHLDVLKQIQTTLLSIQQDYRQLSAAVEAIDGRVNLIAGVKQIHEAAEQYPSINGAASLSIDTAKQSISHSSPHVSSLVGHPTVDSPEDAASGRKPSLATRSSPSRIILTTYPAQSGINPMTMNWGHHNHKERGPVVVSRSQSTIRRRNGKLFIQTILRFFFTLLSIRGKTISQFTFMIIFSRLPR